jgi:hypothetical protein
MISIHNTDIVLISEMHFTEKSYLKLPNYTVYHSNHPGSTRLSAHPNDLAVNLMEHPDNRQLRRYLPNDLPTWFLVYVVFVVLAFKV